MPIQLKSRLTIGALVASLTLGMSMTASATTLRLSTLFNPGSDGAEAVEQFAENVSQATEGRITVQVYPANQLGDWTDVHAQLMQGAVDMALQPLSTSVDPRLAIAWFPYLAATYDEAEEAYSQGGIVHRVVNDMIGDQNLTLLGVFGAGMGGAGFAKEVTDAGNPDADHDLRIRVWPGGTTHRTLMERFGYNVATVPWAELFTAMQTGVVDGQIGGTPEMALDNFKEITRTWVQLNDHFEVAWLVMNRARFDGLSEEDRQAILAAANDFTRERFVEVRETDAQYLETMREAGIDVVTFDDEQLQAFARVAREEVWPEISEEVGEEVMAELQQAIVAQ